MKEWYYVDRNQQRTGPLDASDLVDALRHGKLTTSSLVWQEGMPTWQPISMHLDVLGVPESMRVGMKNKSGRTTWAIVLVVMAAVSIALLGIVIAFYLEYTERVTRSKVQEGLNMAAAAKVAVSETRLTTGAWPNNSAEAGYTDASTKFVSKVTIPSAQDIQITYSSATPEIAGMTVMLPAELSADGKSIEWGCNAAGSNKLNGKSGTLLPKYAPSNCR